VRRMTAIILAASASLGLCCAGVAYAAHGLPPDEHAAPSAFTPSTHPRIVGEIGRRIAAAQDGDTIEIGPGTYHEQVLIDRSITLVGIGRPVIDGGGAGHDIVEITAPDVALRGFVIQNTGIDLDKENAGIRILAPRATIEDNILQDILFGIDLRMAPGSIVRNNRVGGKTLDIARRGDGIRLWRSDDTLIEGNTIHDGRDAILWYSEDVIIRGNRAFRCRYGFHLMFSHRVTLEENELSDNSVGVYLMYSTGVEMHRNRLIRNRGPSGYGIGLKEVDEFTIGDNLIVNNRVGVYIDGSPFTTAKPGEFYRNTIAHNDTGFTFLPSARGNMLWDNNFIGNIEQVRIAGRGSLVHNQFWREADEHDGYARGNFWSDYTGYDQDQSGIGDWVHESYTLFENLLDREPKLRILLFSPAQQAIDFVGRAIPAIRPEPKFADELPLMSPVTIQLGEVGPPPHRGMLGAVGAGLLGIGAGLLLLARSVFFVPSRPLSRTATTTRRPRQIGSVP
jgi:nitrous oxidase accessory protein